jgi:hypothetical protein
MNALIDLQKTFYTESSSSIIYLQTLLAVGRKIVARSLDFFGTNLENRKNVEQE